MLRKYGMYLKQDYHEYHDLYVKHDTLLLCRCIGKL